MPVLLAQPDLPRTPSYVPDGVRRTLTIYWLFASGKQRAFQALVYLHRYNESTLSRMRTEYVIPLQGKVSARIEALGEDIEAASSTSHRRKLEKQRDKLGKQQVELAAFDEKLRHYADQRIALDLDDGVKVNYGKFGDLLAEVKKVTGKAPCTGSDGSMDVEPRSTSGRMGAVVFRLVCAALVALCAAFAAAEKPPASAPGLSGSQRRELTALKATAAGSDLDEAAKAIETIAAMGPGAREELAALLNQLLRRNALALRAGARAAGTPEQAAPAEKELRTLRAEALANIAKLKKDDDSIPKAGAYYKKLLAATRRFAPKLAGRDKLLGAAARRVRLLALCKRFAPGAAEADADAPRPVPLELAGKTLGVSFENVKDTDALKAMPELKGILDYRLNRETFVYNQRIARRLHPEELSNIRRVNDYREALGLLRLEIDLRLVQSARRHASDMAERKFFSHESPVAGSRTFGDRIKKAGYPSPGGENIALGARSGADVLKQWLLSPPHHQNIARERFTAIGVGKWGRHWVQNFGTGKRLMSPREGP